MRQASRLVLLLWLLPCLATVTVTAPGAIPGAHAAETFDPTLATSVFSVGLDFLAPRTLDPIGIPQLTLWGLRGLTAVDPALVPDVRDTEVHLLLNDKLVFTAPLPGNAAAADWGKFAASLGQAAFGVSQPVRNAGTAGVIRSFFDEMFNHLDPYSRYIPPDAADTDRERRSGTVGLGLSLAKTAAGFAVHTVLPGSPADDAGIRPGDRVLSVDGRLPRREDAATVEGWLQGPEGSTVVLAWRNRRGRVRTDELERTLVPPQTVRAERVADVLLIHIDGFSANTDDQFHAALAAGFEGHRVRGVVVDLRGNRGGLLRQAVAATDEVLTVGVVATTAGRNPQAEHVWPAGDSGDAAAGRPIVILVDGRTASAAEIMAAALEDNGRAVVVGSATLGKGLVQTIAPLPDGGELFVTWSRVLAPDGWPLQGLGVLPQLCTSLGADQLQIELQDLGGGQLDMAGALARHNAARAPLPSAQVVELRNACPAAEGRDADLDTAGFLLNHPDAYETALGKPRAN